MSSLSATKDWPGGVNCIGTSTSVSDAAILRPSQFLVKGAFDRPVFVPQILKSDICTRAQEPDTRAHAGTRNEPAHNTRPTRGTWCCHAVPQLATPSS